MERATSLIPNNPDVQYGLVCTRARLGQIEGAIVALSRSADLEFKAAEWASKDPDLRLLRGLPEFEAILARMRVTP